LGVVDTAAAAAAAATATATTTTTTDKYDDDDNDKVDTEVVITECRRFIVGIVLCLYSWLLSSSTISL